MAQGCLQSPAPSVHSLREMCAIHSAGTTVAHVADGRPDWIVDGGMLRHARTNYFSIGLHEDDRGEPILLVEQTETALVMLLVSEIDGRDAVLLSLRTEPGLIGLTNLTATIQSTPSNYLRKHGGKGTPFIDIARDPGSHGTVLHDGEQYDWGEYYLRKTKRFLVVRLDVPVDAPAGFRWVPIETARPLLLEDNLVTNDLRVLIPIVDAARPGRVDDSDPVREADRGSTLRRIEFLPGSSDARGLHVAFFRTETSTREVRSWIQPLLVPRDPMRIRLSSICTASGVKYAVERRTQPGLLGRQLWFPAETRAGRVARTVHTSAEGGRFYRLPIEIELREIDAVDATDPRTASGIRWMSAGEIAALVAQPLQTSLELRMAWSLVHAASLRHA